MPIGTSDGEYFNDGFEYTVHRGVINPDVDPRFMTHDQNVVTPNEMGINQQMDQAEVDPTTGTGIPIGLKRVPVTGGTIDSTMPPQASTEPTDAFKSEEGSQVAPEVDWTKMNQPFGSLKGTAPEDSPIVYQGKNITIREGEIDRAINIGLGVGPGIMMGVKSRILNKSMLEKAQQMFSDGAHPDEIWSNTGTFKGADGRWRQEINDSKALAKPVDDLTGKSLADVLHHPELFKAYPDLKYLEITPFGKDQWGRASYNSANDTIQLAKNAPVDDILHEVQHAIQKREGFAPGGSPAEQFALRFEEEMRIAKIEANQLLQYRKSDAFKGWNKEDEGRIQQLKRLFEVEALRKGLAAAEAEGHYMRLAGEVEARNVETRALLSPEAARAIAPIWTEDTSRQLQHITDRSMWTTPYGPTLRPDIAPSYAPRRGANDNALGSAATDVHDFQTNWGKQMGDLSEELFPLLSKNEADRTAFENARIKKLEKERQELIKANPFK